MGNEPQLKPLSGAPVRGPAAPLPDSTFIPPVANRRSVGKFPAKIVVIIIGCVIALIVSVALMVLARANDPSDDIVRLRAMMQSVSDIVAEGRKSAKNPDVVKFTSDAAILVNGDTATLKSALSTTEVKDSKEITTAEKSANAKILAELKTAATDARFDSTYLPMLRTKLEATQKQLSRVYDRSSKPAIRAATKTVYDHCDSLIKSIDALTP